MTLSRNYIHRSMARRTRIEYSATHMMSEAQPRLSSTACSLMVASPWRSNAMGPPPSHSHKMASDRSSAAPKAGLFFALEPFPRARNCLLVRTLSARLA